MTYEDELWTYPREPVGVTRHQGIWPAPRHRFSLVACARWEARYIVEWLNYHRSIGFEHAYVYCNDDDPAELYEQILPFVQGSDPFVTFHHYSFQGLQFQMYQHFLREHLTETEWFTFLDIDEFICIRGTNAVSSLLDRVDAETDVIYLNWCHYGHNGHMTRPHGSVLANYTRREVGVTPFTKNLMRARTFPYARYYEYFDGPIQHSITHLTQELKLRNVLNEDYATYYENFPDAAWEFLERDERRQRMLDVAYVAHFNIKSDEDFDLRVRRGLKGDYAAEATWGERDAAARAYHHAQTNAVEDTYLRDYWRGRLDLAWEGAVFPRSPWPLLSETDTIAWQSSTLHDRSAADDAQNLVSGRLTGRPQAHTDLQDDPSWGLDLMRVVHLHEVRVFNRLDGVLDRMACFRLDTSFDGARWTFWHEKTDGRLFGGADGNPYRMVDPVGRPARYVRLLVPGADKYLQLDQIQIYGTAS